MNEAAELGVYSLYQDGNQHKLVVYEPRLARKINRTLERYPSTTVFCEGDEVLFTVPETKLTVVKVLLGVK